MFQAIPGDVWERIRYVAVEDSPELTRPHVPDYFAVNKQVAVLRYTNTRLRVDGRPA